MIVRGAQSVGGSGVPHQKKSHLNGSGAATGGKLLFSEEVPIPEQAGDYPKLRYMGSKHRLLSWIYSVLCAGDFETAADPFVGSGCVAYLLKAMGKRVTASDFLNFPAVIASATVGNSRHKLDSSTVEQLLRPVKNGPDFIAQTFKGVFFTPTDLRFLDRASANLEELDHPHQRNLALAALIRSCLKKQPRGVFTVSGDLSHSTTVVATL